MANHVTIPAWAEKPYALLVEAYHAAALASDGVVDHHYAGTPVVVQNWKEVQSHLEELPRTIRGVDVLGYLTDLYRTCERHNKNRWGVPASMYRAVANWGSLTLFLGVRGLLEELDRRKTKVIG